MLSMRLLSFAMMLFMLGSMTATRREQEVTPFDIVVVTPSRRVAVTPLVLLN